MLNVILGKEYPILKLADSGALFQGKSDKVTYYSAHAVVEIKGITKDHITEALGVLPRKRIESFDEPARSALRWYGKSIMETNPVDNSSFLYESALSLVAPWHCSNLPEASVGREGLQFCQ